MDITTLTIHEAKKMLDSGELTSYDLTKAYIDRIKEVDSLVKAYVTVCEEEALNKAHPCSLPCPAPRSSRLS